jgi:hypothetical protein
MFLVVSGRFHENKTPDNRIVEHQIYCDLSMGKAKK